jgi:hypothetical protein
VFSDVAYLLNRRTEAELPLASATCLQLVRFSPSAGTSGLRLVPDAASLPSISRDGRTYRFKVDASFTRFSDSSRVTAWSFALAIRRILRRSSESPVKHLLRDVRAVRTSGGTLTIKLRRPAPELLATLALPVFCVTSSSPREEDRNPHDAPDVIPGAGPYFMKITFEDGIYEGRIELWRNRFYHGPRRGGPDRVSITYGYRRDPIGDLERGEADLVPSWDLGLKRDAGRATRIASSRSYEGRAVGQIVFNARERSPFANRRLRQAVALIVNRQEAARFQSRSARPTDLLTPSRHGILRRGSYYGMRRSSQAIARAQELVRGLVPVQVTTRISAMDTRSIAEDLRAIGITLAIRSTAVCDHAADVYFTALREPILVSFAGHLKTYPEPSPCYWPSHPVTDWVPELRAALRKSGRARERALAAVERRVITQDVPAVGLFVPMKTHAYSRRVGCVRAHPYYELDFATLCRR